jgi:hypothetical protein
MALPGVPYTDTTRLQSKFQFMMNSGVEIRPDVLTSEGLQMPWLVPVPTLDLNQMAGSGYGGTIALGVIGALTATKANQPVTIPYNVYARVDRVWVAAQDGVSVPSPMLTASLHRTARRVDVKKRFTSMDQWVVAEDAISGLLETVAEEEMDEGVAKAAVSLSDDTQVSEVDDVNFPVEETDLCSLLKLKRFLATPGAPVSYTPGPGLLSTWQDLANCCVFIRGDMVFHLAKVSNTDTRGNVWKGATTDAYAARFEEGGAEFLTVECPNQSWGVAWNNIYYMVDIVNSIWINGQFDSFCYNADAYGNVNVFVSWDDNVSVAGRVAFKQHTFTSSSIPLDEVMDLIAEEDKPAILGAYEKHRMDEALLLTEKAVRRALAAGKK